MKTIIAAVLTFMCFATPLAADPWTGFRIGLTGSQVEGDLSLDLEVLPQPERTFQFDLPVVADERLPGRVPDTVSLTVPAIPRRTERLVDLEYSGYMKGLEVGVDWRPRNGPVVLGLGLGYQIGSVTGETAQWYAAFGQQAGYGAEVKITRRATLNPRAGFLPTETLLLFVQYGLEAVYAKELTGWACLNERCVEESTSGWAMNTTLGFGAEWRPTGAERRPTGGQWSLAATVTPFRGSLTESLVDTDWFELDGHLAAEHTTVQVSVNWTF